MPNICDLAKTLPHARFNNHYSGGNCTKTGIFSLFYGIPGNYFDQALRSNAGAAMIDAMVKLGYDVKAYAGGTLQAPPFNRTVFASVPDIEVDQKGRTKIGRDISAIRNCARYLENKIREGFGFEGTSIKFVFREKGRKLDSEEEEKEETDTWSRGTGSD